METEKLFYADPFLTEFDAKVLACEAGRGGFDVVLDRTAFYPEGGGQPYDTGVLGGVEVSEVHEKAGVVTHKCAAPLPVGETVHGRLDWARRFDHMQQHSGEHICSGLICARYGCDNVGFHMGAESVTIDFNADIPWEELLELEAAANRYIYEDHAIDIQLHRGAELDAIDYRSKKPLEGDVRIVTFPGADCCACCGTHVMRSGQVGIVKFLSVQKFREGVRIELLCGGRAYRYLSACWAQDVAAAQALSVKPTASAAAVERLLGEGAPGKYLAFVGDGINDAPVLARADLGAAMGGIGSDAAIEAADIVLMDDDPRKLSLAMRISRKTMRLVWENIVFALAVKAVCLVLGALGIANMWVAIFADVGVMVLCVLNAARALNTKHL